MNYLMRLGYGLLILFVAALHSEARERERESQSPGTVEFWGRRWTRYRTCPTGVKRDDSTVHNPGAYPE